MEKWETPHDLQEILTKINSNVNEFAPTFLKYVVDMSKTCFCPFKIRDSRTNRKCTSFLFTCKYSGKNKFKYQNCPAKIRFKVSNDIVKFAYAEWNHNHPIEEDSITTDFNVLTTEQKQIIHEMRLNGSTPGHIRIALNLMCSPNDLYNASRNAIKDRMTK